MNTRLDHVIQLILIAILLTACSGGMPHQLLDHGKQVLEVAPANGEVLQMSAEFTRRMLQNPALIVQNPNKVTGFFFPYKDGMTFTYANDAGVFLQRAYLISMDTWTQNIKPWLESSWTTISAAALSPQVKAAIANWGRAVTVIRSPVLLLPIPAVDFYYVEDAPPFMRYMHGIPGGY